MIIPKKSINYVNFQPKIMPIGYIFKRQAGSQAYIEKPARSACRKIMVSCADGLGLPAFKHSITTMWALGTGSRGAWQNNGRKWKCHILTKLSIKFIRVSQ